MRFFLGGVAVALSRPRAIDLSTKRVADKARRTKRQSGGRFHRLKCLSILPGGPPLVLALVLGDKAEDSFRQAMLVSQGELSIMYANPLVGSITTLALVMLFWPLISKLMGKLRPAKLDPLAAQRPVD